MNPTAPTEYPVTPWGIAVSVGITRFAMERQTLIRFSANSPCGSERSIPARSSATLMTIVASFRHSWSMSTFVTAPNLATYCSTVA